MKAKKIIYNTLCTFLFLTFFTACGDDSPSGAGNCNDLTWAEVYAQEYETYSEASIDYANEPTVQSCNAYKNTTNNWLETLKGLSKNCLVGISEAEYQEFLENAEEAQEEVNEIDCTQYN